MILEKGQRAYVKAPDSNYGWNVIILEYFNSEFDDEARVGFNGSAPDFAKSSFYGGYFVPAAYVYEERRRPQ